MTIPAISTKSIIYYENNKKVKEFKRDKTYLFKCLLLANFLQYLEAGAVPALLLELSKSFHMGSGKQGLLGGVVYLSLSLGSPFAGYLLRKFEHKAVICSAVIANMFFTLIWALTPIGEPYSTNMFIAVRFMMGLCQCIVCVFLPLWTNENSPKDQRTSWMSYLQASVPFGVMMGYIIASVMTSVSQHVDTCLGLTCWRWPFLIEVMLLSPLYCGLYFIPKEDIAINIRRPSSKIPNNNITNNGNSNPNTGQKIVSSPKKTSSLSISPTTTTTASTTIQRNSPDKTNIKRNSPLKSSIMLTGYDENMVDNIQLTHTTNDTSSYQISDNLTFQAPNNDDEDINPNISMRSPLPTTTNTYATSILNTTTDRMKRKEEEKRRRSSLRQQAMTASMFDSMSLQHAYKGSTDKMMSLLDPTEEGGVFNSLPTIRWSATPKKDSNYSKKTTLNYNIEEELEGEEEGYQSIHSSNMQPMNHKKSIASIELKDHAAIHTYNPILSMEEDNIIRSITTTIEDNVPHSSSNSATKASSQSIQEWLLSGWGSSSTGGGRSPIGLGTRSGIPPTVPTTTTSSSSNIRKVSIVTNKDHHIITNNHNNNSEDILQNVTNEKIRLLDHDIESGGYQSLSNNSQSVKNNVDHNTFTLKSKLKRTRNRVNSLTDEDRTQVMGDSTAESTMSAISRQSNNKTLSLTTTTTVKREEPQYESLRDLKPSKSIRHLQKKRTSWDMLSMLRFSTVGRTSPSTASSPDNSTHNEHPVIRRFYSSDDIDTTTGRHVLRSNVDDSPTSSSRSRAQSYSNYSKSFTIPEGDGQSIEMQISPIDKPDTISPGNLSLYHSISEDENTPGNHTLSGDDNTPGILDQESEDSQSDTSAREASGEDSSVDLSDSEEEEWAGLTPYGRSTSDYETPINIQQKPNSYHTSNTIVGVPFFATDSLKLNQRWHMKAYRKSRNVYDSLKALLSIKTYRYLLGVNTALYFTVTGVQYWGTKYLTIALNAPLPLVNTLFIICAATGPTLGVFFGGWIVDLCGGYKGPHQRVVALEICTTFGILASIFSLPITFLDNIFAVVSFLWVVLFFGGSMLPACSGIIVSIVPRDYRPTSSSLSLVVFNMFGYFLSLLLSGYLMQILDTHSDICNEICSMTWGFRLVLFWSFISLFFLMKALFASYQHLKDIDRSSTGKIMKKKSKHHKK